MNTQEKITCRICNAQIHVVERHLAEKHPEVSMAEYRERFPDAPIMSEYAQNAVNAHLQSKREKSVQQQAPSPELVANYTGLASFKIGKRNLAELFGMPNAKTKAGKDIKVTVLEQVGAPDMVPALDENYHFDLDDLKAGLLALEMNKPCYTFGHKGTGKTEMWEQVCARTGRPQIRVQHTVNTEESHITGQYTVKDGSTVFNYGPLALAMINGWVYLADEYDFALPAVTAVYQPVLEGKALYIKDAPVDMRVVKPHPNFRFIATGNTNGSGDETGLYGGTVVQNAANYDRFAVMIHKKYLPSAIETKVIQARTGLLEDDAGKIVKFGNEVRQAFDGGKLSDTLSTRTLINISQVGIAFSSFRLGVQLSFSNKLSSIDKKVVDDLASRIFS